MGQEQRNTAAQHLGRVIPIQIQRQVDNAQQQNQQIQQQQHQQLQNQQHQHQQQQRWGTNLPVQVGFVDPGSNLIKNTKNIHKVPQILDEN